MSYGGGGVAKGGYDCRYRCVEEDVYRRNCKSHTNAQQNSRRFQSTTARPLATPFDTGQPAMLNCLRKNARGAFSLRKQLKCATPLGDPPGFRPGCASHPTHTTTRVNWSSGMSYGGGGVAKGGYDCRYRCGTVYCGNCKSHTNNNKTGVTKYQQPRVHTPRCLTESYLGC